MPTASVYISFLRCAVGRPCHFEYSVAWAFGIYANVIGKSLVGTKGKMRIEKAFEESCRIIRNEIKNATESNPSWDTNVWNIDATFGGSSTLTTEQKDMKKKRKIAYVIVGIKKFDIFIKRHKKKLERLNLNEDLEKFQTECTDFREEHEKEIGESVIQYANKHPFFHRKHRGTVPIKKRTESPKNENQGPTNDYKTLKWG